MKKLEAKGYVTRVRSKKDERNLEFIATELGLELIDKVLNVPEEMTRCIDLSRQDDENLYCLFIKF